MLTGAAFGGVCGAAQGPQRARAAEPLLRRTLAARREVLGDSHADTAESLEALGKAVLGLQGATAEAEALLREAVSVRRAALGSSHVDTCESLSSLAQLLMGTGRMGEAESAFREVVTARAAALGARHHHTLSAMNGLAVVLNEEGRLAEAAELLRTVLAAAGEVRRSAPQELQRRCFAPMRAALLLLRLDSQGDC